MESTRDDNAGLSEEFSLEDDDEENESLKSIISKYKLLEHATGDFGGVPIYVSLGATLAVFIIQIGLAIFRAKQDSSPFGSKLFFWRWDWGPLIRIWRGKKVPFSKSILSNEEHAENADSVGLKKGTVAGGVLIVGNSSSASLQMFECTPGSNDLPTAQDCQGFYLEDLEAPGSQVSSGLNVGDVESKDITSNLLVKGEDFDKACEALLNLESLPTLEGVLNESGWPHAGGIILSETGYADTVGSQTDCLAADPLVQRSSSNSTLPKNFAGMKEQNVSDTKNLRNATAHSSHFSQCVDSGDATLADSLSQAGRKAGVTPTIVLDHDGEVETSMGVSSLKVEAEKVESPSSSTGNRKQSTPPPYANKKGLLVKRLYYPLLLLSKLKGMALGSTVGVLSTSSEGGGGSSEVGEESSVGGEGDKSLKSNCTTMMVYEDPEERDKRLYDSLLDFHNNIPELKMLSEKDKFEVEGPVDNQGLGINIGKKFSVKYRYKS